MELKSSVNVECQSLAGQEVLSASMASMALMAPGGTTTCLGSTRTSCCCSAAAVSTPNGFEGDASF